MCMHQWRNWQTRMIQVHMGRLVQVQVLSGAPLTNKASLRMPFVLSAYQSSDQSDDDLYQEQENDQSSGHDADHDEEDSVSAVFR